MALDEINQYAITATEIKTESFMDIDQYISPGVWESQKVPKSVFDAEVVAAGQNFANTDLTLDAARSHTIGAFTFYMNATGGAFMYLNQVDAQFGRGGNYTVWDSTPANEVRTYVNSVERYTIGATETVVNDTGGSFDFRVEGDTDANLLFADASTDFVGVGTNSPQAKVDIHAQGSLSTDKVLNIRNSADTADILSINGDGLDVSVFVRQPMSDQN